MANCLICGSTRLEVFYKGTIRMGSFGKWSETDHEITECRDCGARHLPPLMGNLDDYYRDGTYRQDLDQGNTLKKYFELTDDDQPHKLQLLGPHSARGKVIADIGAGAGPFLDLVKGMAATTIAVEPNEAYHASLRERGHLCYPSTQAMLREWAGKVDLAVSFSVIEHVERPREFLEEIRAALKPAGRLLTSTPNADDLLLEICPAYPRFFYRKVHLWYFTPPALTRLANLAGFATCRIIHQHRFDLANAMLWLRDGKPSGVGKLTTSPALDDAWRNFLEQSGRGDYLYAELKLS